MTQFNWGSRCAECGKPMPSGTIQSCSKGGWCSHHIPAAARESMSDMHEELQQMVEYWSRFIQTRGDQEVIDLAREAIAKADGAQ